MLSGDIPPSQTIYIKNLNEKVKKEGNPLKSLSLASSAKPFVWFPRNLYKR